MPLDFHFVVPNPLREISSPFVVALPMIYLRVLDTGAVNMGNSKQIQILLVLSILHGVKFTFCACSNSYGLIKT